MPEVQNGVFGFNNVGAVTTGGAPWATNGAINKGMQFSDSGKAKKTLLLDADLHGNIRAARRGRATRSGRRSRAMFKAGSSPLPGIVARLDYPSTPPQ